MAGGDDHRVLHHGEVYRIQILLMTIIVLQRIVNDVKKAFILLIWTCIKNL